jgi:exopolysaccharide biosynthesis predicted pyruvyltransferase EpsI
VPTIPRSDPPAHVRCGDLIARLAAEAEAAVASVLPRGSRCALVGFPNHDNAGDSAIWIGEKALLERLEASVVYACDVRTYSRESLARALGDGVILLHGGGNFGDLWERQQQLRERVLEDFRRVPVIQLPQSIHFAKASSFARFKAIVRRHGDVAVLAREPQSLARARMLGVTAVPCPDLAFMLGPLDVRETPLAPIVWLARTDRESLFPNERRSEPGIITLDWIRPVENEPAWPPAASEALTRIQALTRQIEEQPEAELESSQMLAAYDLVAAQRLARGCRILSRGQVVVTDRLHGHILALLLGLPNVVMDNSYGKIRSVYQSWTRPCPLGVWAESPNDALASARRLLR